MHKKNIIGLTIFAGIVTVGLFVGATFLINQDSKTDKLKSPAITSDANASQKKSNSTDLKTSKSSKNSDDKVVQSENTKDSSNSGNSKQEKTAKITSGPDKSDAAEADTKAVSAIPDLQLIIDSSKVNYKQYIPDMVYDKALKEALNIDNPKLTINAKSAILIDANTKQVLYYKKAVTARFPASTAKLLTSLVALDWCKVNEKITVGDEVTMIAPDSTRAYLRPGEKLTLRNLLEGMLLPSGNDAAYATAAYVGRKSLQNPNATKKEAVKEFVRLMNLKAEELGVKNSCFKSPDGYDCIGQYTTAYDMALIGLAASDNKAILNVTKKARSRNILRSGQDLTWTNTNKLINRYSGEYYPYAIGLKTGTSTMAGKNLIAAARKGGKKVICVIMNSSSVGRWEDAIKLLKYGLK